MLKKRQGHKPLRIEDQDSRPSACGVCGKLDRRLKHGACSECRTLDLVAEIMASRRGYESMEFEDAHE